MTAPAALDGFGPLISFILSISALRDWAKLLIIGSFFETCRRLLATLWSSTIDSFFITATFEDYDDSYKWMMIWLSKQPSWKNVRNVNISTTQRYSGNASLSEEEPDRSGLPKVSFLPAVSGSYTLWYKYTWMRITRVSEQIPGWGPNQRDSLNISIFTRNHNILNDILQEAKKAYLDAQGSSITVYVSDSTNCWRELATRRKRPLDSIILDPGIRELVVEDAQDFLDSKRWYAERGIPFRRGYLLYGAPGSGKTSLIHSIAGELELDVYIISLSRSGLDDTGLSELISDLPERCIALMEDIDAALHNSLSREDAPTPPKQTAEPIHSSLPTHTTSKVSLSGLLNALDGIGAQEGRILFATTNKYSSLDPALCRPGRMDLHIEFKLASRYQADELFKRFYLSSSPKTPADNVQEPNSNPAQSHPNRSTCDGGSSNLIDLDVPDTTDSPSSSCSEKSERVAPTYKGTRHHGHAPQLSSEQLSALAAQFASAIPEREVSMAALQGYLMSQKSRPWEAAREVSAWLEKELATKKVQNEIRS
ncbi:P-loop containing nucleoside triphosphate hydrolase protein [Suillus bovinus]|uniref:P-loop containing nucleoside triphosphate hydrolase protein n=1 Tax=Suillus bovinus TaxID=48563 RepID=UPI001B86C954|nr:P-loop containing nucleoside triphosphate hydrolase protein [Suillus bovinus]KAG2137620.1 P-loop containing nucleoside triphosphate hydrolase protein [Suillus bovinus]